MGRCERRPQAAPGVTCAPGVSLGASFMGQFPKVLRQPYFMAGCLSE